MFAPEDEEVDEEEVDGCAEHPLALCGSHGLWEAAGGGGLFVGLGEACAVRRAVGVEHSSPVRRLWFALASGALTQLEAHIRGVKGERSFPAGPVVMGE